MFNKITLLMFAATVLLLSFAVMIVPQASALTKSVEYRYYSTASYGNSQVCGDHKCTPGEKTQWLNAMYAAQKVSYGKVGTAPHGEDVMTKLALSAPATTLHGNTK